MEPSARAKIACDSCYAKKIKCTGNRPSCIWCTHNGNPCTFDRDHRLRKVKRAVEKSSRSKPYGQILARLDRLEQAMAALEKAPDAEDILANTPERVSSPTDTLQSRFSPLDELSIVSGSKLVHISGWQLGTVSSLSGKSLFSSQGQDWLRKCTGYIIRLAPAELAGQSLFQGQRNGISLHQINCTETKRVLELPDLELLYALLESFDQSDYKSLFPVVDTLRFHAIIADVYSTEHIRPPNMSVLGAKFSIYAFFAFASALNMNGLGKSVCTEDHVLRAHHLLPIILKEPVSLEGLQGLVMLALFDLYSGNILSASYFCSLAARSMFALEAEIASGVEIEPKSDIANVEQQSRNLFWLCYIMDKGLSLRTGHPSVFNDDMCDLRLPPGYAERLRDFGSISTSDQCPLFPTDLNLSILKSKIFSSLYSPSAFREDNIEILRRIRELDEDLENWRVSLPISVRPSLSFSQDRLPIFVHDIRAVILRLEYHQCMAITHLAISRCNAESSQTSSILVGINSSLALSTEASRSTLNYLLAAGPVIDDHLFWLIIAYPLAGLVVLFCTILEHPADSQSKADLELLQSSLVAIRRNLNRRNELNELVHIEHITSFVAELCRLAKRAIHRGSG